MEIMQHKKTGTIILKTADRATTYEGFCLAPSKKDGEHPVGHFDNNWNTSFEVVTDIVLDDEVIAALKRILNKSYSEEIIGHVLEKYGIKHDYGEYITENNNILLIGPIASIPLEDIKYIYKNRSAVTFKFKDDKDLSIIIELDENIKKIFKLFSDKKSRIAYTNVKD